MDNNTNTPLAKATNKKELAREMGISYNTLRRRLSEAGLKIPRGTINPGLRLEILKKLGWYE
jgi:predicted DNA-binding protein (UPF0251 family)